MNDTILDKFNQVERVHLIAMFEYATKPNTIIEKADKALTGMLVKALSEPSYMDKLKSWMYGYENGEFLRKELLPEIVGNFEKVQDDEQSEPLLAAGLHNALIYAKHRSGNVVDFSKHYDQDAEDMYVSMVEAFKHLPYDDEHKKAKHYLMWYTGMSCKPETFLLKEGVTAMLLNHEPEEFTLAIEKYAVHENNVLHIRRLREILKDAQDVALSSFPAPSM